MNVQNITISARLKLGFGAVVALLLVLVASAVLQMKSLRTASLDLSDNWLPSVQYANAMNTNTSDFRLTEFQHVLNTDDKAMAQIEAALVAVSADFNKNRDAYVPLISSPEEKALWDRFSADWKRYLDIHTRLIELSRQNKNEEAKALLEGESAKLFDQSSEALLKIVNLNAKGGMSPARVPARLTRVPFGSWVA